MMKHYDYMIVGAGPAGCFAAAMLAERGWKVIVLERREKGFCKLCGDGISVQAVHVLRQAGFPAERLEAAGAVRIKTVCHKRGDTLSRMTLGDELKIVYSDGTKKTFVYQETTRDGYPAELFVNAADKTDTLDLDLWFDSDQSYTHQWGYGKHNFTYQLYGRSFTFEVNVVRSK